MVGPLAPSTFGVLFIVIGAERVSDWGEWAHLERSRSSVVRRQRWLRRSPVGIMRCELVSQV